MNLQIATTPWTTAAGDWLIVPVAEGCELTGPLGQLNDALGGWIARIRESQDFVGKLAETAVSVTPAGIAAKRLLLVGLGTPQKLTEAGLYKALATAARAVSGKKTERVVVALGAEIDAAEALRRSRTAATAFAVGCVGQDLYRNEKKRFPFEMVEILLPAGLDAQTLQPAVDAGLVLGDSINLARELVNQPAQVMYPESFANRAVALAREFQLGCEVLDQPALEKEKMGSLLAVAAGSDRPPRLVVLEHKAAAPGAPVLALVGKGVTFDSGGLSLKPTDGMLTMKCDMAGAATVLATMVAIARLKLPVHVIGLMGLVENMTGGSAMKLGDVLTARSGVTIEVQNTDAEGRLVLADVLDYAVSKGADRIVDLATLTGACVVALGEEVVGAMSNNQEWCDQVLNAAKAVGEDIWQLPMFPHYDELIKSDVADIRNVGGRWGGAITAAKFLERFVKERPWVHLDIAGPAFAASDKPHREGGGTGCMVRTLVELVSRSA
ncbi:MAG: leucyl aminopeptidase [Planctomycetes bacterium]|nr:leucyl aminopeptidase [Planctomycetota bacterium]